MLAARWDLEVRYRGQASLVLRWMLCPQNYVHHQFAGRNKPLVWTKRYWISLCVGSKSIEDHCVSSSTELTAAQHPLTWILRWYIQDCAVRQQSRFSIPLYNPSLFFSLTINLEKHSGEVNKTSSLHYVFLIGPNKGMLLMLSVYTASLKRGKLNPVSNWL